MPTLESATVKRRNMESNLFSRTNEPKNPKVGFHAEYALCCNFSLSGALLLSVLSVFFSTIQMLLSSIRSGISLLVFLPLVLAGCSSVNDQNPSTTVVSGFIRTDDSSAVPDALVEALSSDGAVFALDSTDADGEFRFTGMPATTSITQIRVTHAEYGKALQPVTSGSQNYVLVTLSHHDSCCGSVTVNAVANGSVLNGVGVTLHKGGHRIAHRTANHGSTTMSHLCEGEYIITVSKAGFHPSLDTLTISGCDSLVTTITLQAVSANPHDSCCSNSASVTIVDSANSEWLPGAVVHVLKDGHQIQAVPTDHNGNATINHLCEGTYKLQVSSPGFVTKTMDLIIDCDEQATIEIPLVSNHPAPCCSGSLNLTVTHEGHAGMNIDSATVTLQRGHETIAQSVTGADGIASFTSLCEDTPYTLSVSAHGYNSESITFTTADCAAQSHSISLRPQ